MGAPRGVPQIEVSFDIDADGILNMGAKDKGTGKEQSIVIQSSGGLSDEDIENMVRDAEANAESDKLKKSVIEKKNEIDSLVYSTEKTFTENKDKLDDETNAAVETAIKEAKEAVESADESENGVAELKAKSDALQQASMKIGQAIYGQQQAGGDEAGE